MWKLTSALLVSLLVCLNAYPADVGNRLTYLDEFCDPYYAGLERPKLVTPQWVGEEGVEAVIVLAIDDLRKAEQHEEFLRPIFQRLKRIDGRAPVSIMTNHVDPNHPLVQKWLGEGVNLETHTDDHPCPCLQGSDLAKAKGSFDRCVDAIGAIANARPVAFRMPCCDSMNSVSPRFFREIFNKTTPQGRFLSIDTSIFHIFSANDPDLPRQLAFDEDRCERFRKYVPTDRVMANLIEDYPYPYVIARLCWEIPALMPSDWDAQHLNGKCSPTTVRDLKAAVDAAVQKQGIFSICFHAHGWIRNDQIIEVINHAVGRHGTKLKFLNFREVQERLDKNLLAGHPLRAANGQDNGVRLLDVNNDGYMDVVVGNERGRRTRLWTSKTGQWTSLPLPVDIVAVDGQGDRRETGVRFGVLQKSGAASVLVQNDQIAGLWHFDGRNWVSDPHGLDSLQLSGPVYTSPARQDQGVRLRDLDRDGVCELIVGNQKQQAVFRWSAIVHTWLRLPFTLPQGTAIVDAQGRDAGLRFVDFDEDGFHDVVFSNADAYSAWVFTSINEGWSRCVLSGVRGQKDPKDELPMIVRADGTNNGAWFNYRHMWVQNEDTGKTLPEHVDSRCFTGAFQRGEGRGSRGEGGQL